MIKSSLKNFFKNLIYLFIPMGIVYLFLLIAVFGAASSVFQSLGQAIEKLSELIHLSTEQSSSAVNDFLAYSMSKLDWSGSILNTIRQIINTHWIKTTLLGFFETIGASTEGFEEQFTVIVNEFMTDIKATVIIAAIVSVLGMAAAGYATRFALRTSKGKIGMKKFIVIHAVIPVAQVLIIVVSIVLLLKIKYFTALVIVLFLMLSNGLSLLSSWLIHKNDKVKLKDVLTVKNIISHFAVQGVILLIDIVFAVGIYFIDPLLCILLVIPLAIYSFGIADINTDYFVSSLTEGSKEKEAAL